ncbi:T9SS type A sorting domain-containing protein [uncultured Porphyromonas sp.]|uniref:InlB B-repeat-containing protein n=1 Tax=uncultured Porphyromonas sp. TaxID=159274 RepID=UPI0026081370|nr:T9SS type A sorting domain-containing protein [uncultured Porphyromonas sp.]
MKRLLPILLCFLALAVPRLYGQETHTVTFSAEPASEKNYVAVKDYNTYDEIASGTAVKDGTQISVYAYCDKNKYAFDYWEIDGVRSEEFQTDKIKGYVVTKDVTFVAHFRELEMLPITFSANGPGTVTAKDSKGVVVNSEDKIIEGFYVRFLATPNENAEIVDWTINGERTKAGKTKFSYKVERGKPNTVVANFKSTAPAGHTVKYSADPAEGGTVKATYFKDGKEVSLVSGETLPESSYITFKAEANEGYEFEKFTVNGIDAPEDFANPGQYATELSGDLNVVAIFKSTAPAEEYTVTFAADPAEGGTVTATRYDSDKDEEVPFETGAKFSGDENYLTFTAKANDGYEIVSWIANGKDVTPSDPKKLGELEYQAKAALDLKVVFKKLQKNYVVTLQPCEHGTISIKEDVDLKAVPDGTKLTVVAKGANDKCELKSLKANGKDILKDKTFTVTEDVTVVAEFVDHTGVDAVTTTTLSIYPNPAKEIATVTGLAPKTAVALYTLDGQLITRLRADHAGSLQIDLTALSDGTYLVVTDGATQRLVVKH